MSAGSWGAVHEPAASGILNVNALAGTNNVLLDTNMFRAVNLQPEALQVRFTLVGSTYCHASLTCHSAAGKVTSVLLMLTSLPTWLHP